MNNENDAISKTIEEFIPKSLDDIIRKNRDQAQLRLATEQELSTLHQSIPEGMPKACIDDWRFFTIRNLSTNDFLVRLLGIRTSDGLEYITSQVKGVDLTSGLVMTSHSLYQLGRQGVGEPPFDQLALVCVTLRGQGAGEYFGIPPFFY